VTSPLLDRVVLVTGAARGIGAATARELAARGARVAGVGLEPEALEALAHELGPRHLWAEADVTDHAAVAAAVERVVAETGRLDAVVANAGVVNYGTLRSATPHEFVRTIDVNLTGVYRTLHATVPHLVRSRGYALVVSSVAAFTALPGGAAYAASKAGAEALASSARAELAHLGVGVGSAHPCWIDTDMVRNADRDLPGFAEMRAQLPWPARAVTSVEACAVALADGVERRARRVYVPRAAAVISALRSVLGSAPVERAVFKQTGSDFVRMLDRHLPT
jgi:NAD(P)-dependent dehydrogenase (short-subunit alcohol dehydrogenase family)